MKKIGFSNNSKAFESKASVLFVTSNIFFSFSGFVRSFFIMRHLELYEVGLISLIQTIIMFLSLSQIGFINGGYRIYCQNDHIVNVKVNNSIHTFLLILTLTSLPVVLIFSINGSLSGQIELGIVGIFVGLITIFKNWISNLLIASGKLNVISKLNFLTGISIIAFSLLIPQLGYLIVVASICFAPIFFVAYGYIKHTFLRPKRLYFDLNFYKRILFFGFVPFLAGIFGQLNIQIENWGIALGLGVKDLGMFYLPALITSLFVLVPNSINALLFPKAIRSFTESDNAGFKKIIKVYYIFNVFYVLLVVGVVLSFISPIIHLVFPKHVDGIRFVYIILPGLVFKLLAEPLWLVFNAAVKFKPIFWSNLLGVIITGVGIVLLNYFEIITLERVAMLKSIVGLVLFISTIIFFSRLKNVIKDKLNKGVVKT